jgi:uncharacterized protein YndB with AHSA1/START domain
MSTQSTEAPVRTSIVVDAPVERAFSVFTDDMGSWWPPEHHILEGELEEIVLEPHIGGRIYDRATDGTTCAWARVLAYDPPNRIVFSWDIGLDWQIETDPDKTSEVAVTFTAETPARTRVELTHSGIERHGEGWERMRDAVASPDGWGVGMRRFAQRLAT